MTRQLRMVRTYAKCSSKVVVSRILKIFGLLPISTKLCQTCLNRNGYDISHASPTICLGEPRTSVFNAFSNDVAIIILFLALFVVMAQAYKKLTGIFLN